MLGRKDSAGSVVSALQNMGTLEGTKMNQDLTFDGTAKNWPVFKVVMIKFADSKNFGYMLEGGHGICAMFQAASAAAARATRSGTTGTISLDIETYTKKEIEEEFKKTSVMTSVALAVRGNRKDKLGASWADALKCGLTEAALTEAHKVLDVKYLKEVDRTLARILHDAVFPGGSETIATTRLRSILKTKQAAKIIAGEAVGGEDLYSSQPWTMLSMQMWAKLTYRFEGMTEMINGAFMDDLGELLSSVTGQQRKTLYEIDQEFEKMCEMLLKFFGTIK